MCDYFLQIKNILDNLEKDFYNLKNENISLKNALSIIQEEQINQNKVSYILAKDKELNDVKNQLKYYEKKYGQNKQVELPEQAESNNLILQNVEKKNINIEKKNKISISLNIEKKDITSENIEDYIFVPDTFEEINDYELLKYKKKYYLRNLETNEIYNIYENKPYSVVGLMTHGKIKLN